MIPGFDERLNRYRRTGETWAEREVDKIGQRAWKRVGMTRERTLRRLTAYMSQGMSKSDAIERLRQSLEPPHTGPANPGALAIMGIDD